MKKYIPIILIIISFLLSGLSFLYFPDSYATHWGADGMADGYSQKGIGLLLFPIIQIVVIAFMYWVPKVDPKKQNINLFKEEYTTFINVFMIFFTYIQGISFIWNMGFTFNFSYAMIPALSGLMLGIATLLEKSKQNYMVGIKTPWTLASEEVWNKTHGEAARYLRIGAAISMFGIFIPQFGFVISLTGIILPFIWAFIFSYIEYSRKNK